MPYSFYLIKPDNFTYDFGNFINRPNRFIAHVRYKNEIKRCHVPDTGRLKELLIPDRKVFLRIPKNRNEYKTFAAVVAVQISDNNWVSIDSQLANRFFKNEWKNLPIFKEYNKIKSEPKLHEGSRLDFLLIPSNPVQNRCLIEVKSVTLHYPEKSGIGLFPDAPTRRGSKHIKELIHAKKKNYRAIILFVVPRNDINEVRLNYKTDPDFSFNLINAFSDGVELLAIRCLFNTEGIKFDAMIPVNLDN